MTWLWEAEDLDLRVAYIRAHGPSDFVTLLARYVASRVNWALALILTPVDKIVQVLGHVMFIFAVIPLMLLLLLTIVWFPVWGALVGTSWLWLRYSWARPILIIPGILVSFVATIFVMLVPDPQKKPEYVILMQEWPLSWEVFRPSEEYYESEWSHVGPRRYQPNL